MERSVSALTLSSRQSSKFPFIRGFTAVRSVPSVTAVPVRVWVKDMTRGGALSNVSL